MTDRIGPALIVVAAIALGSCGDDGTTAADVTADDRPTSTAVDPAGDAAPLTVDESSFPNLADLTPVRGFFVENLSGDLDATLAVAQSSDGGTYPVGSLVQLVPGEAMVKREAGFSPGTNDWEFFELDVSAEGTEIRARGGVEVVNRFGGSCADCHARAEPQWDLICEQDHGCDPLPLDREAIVALQDGDPRPRRTE